MKSVRSWLAAAFVVTVCASSAAWAGSDKLVAQPAPGSKVSDDAKQAIQAMLAAYGARKDYQAGFTLTTESQIGKVSRNGSVKGIVRLSRPNKLHVQLDGEGASFSLSCDGKRCMAYYSVSQKYLTWKAPDNLDSLLGNDALAQLLGDMARVTLLPFSSDPYRTFLLGVSSAELAPPEPGKGAHLRLEVQTGELDIWLDPQTSLVTEARAVPTRLIELIKAQDPKAGDVRVSIDLKQQVANAGQPVPAEDFSVAPPEGAKPATTWKDLSELSPLEQMVDFQLPGLTEGTTVQLSDYKGKVVALDFWATNCQPCQIELPVLQGIYQDLAGKGLVLLAVSEGDTREAVAEFLKLANLDILVALDADGKVGQTYHVRGLPTLYLIGRDGKVAGFFEGFDPTKVDELRDQITKLVEAAPPAAR